MCELLDASKKVQCKNLRLSIRGFAKFIGVRRLPSNCG